MTDPAEQTGCACCGPADTASSGAAPAVGNDRRQRFVAGLRRLEIDGEDLTQLGQLRDAGDCAALRQRLTQTVTAKLHTTQARIVELIEHAAHLQADATGTLGTPPAVADVQLEIATLGGLSQRLQDAVGPLSAPSMVGGCHDDCPCSQAVAATGTSVAQVPASRTALTLQSLASPGSAIVCTLDGGVDAMRVRVSEWQAAISAATARDAIDGGVALTFAHDADLVVELARLAAAEYACCTFFTFTLTVSSQGVRFDVRAPEQARDVVSAVFGVAAPPAEPDSPPAMPAAFAAPAKRIGRDELCVLLERGSVVLVEALAQQQYDAEHLPGAVNVPDELTADIAARLVPTRDTTVVVYCSGPGCTRSKVAAAAFVRLGYSDVYVYPGGKSDWADAGLPFEGTRTTVGA